MNITNQKTEPWTHMDREFLTSIVKDILTEVGYHPTDEAMHEIVEKFLVAGNNENFRELFGLSKAAVTKLWTDNCSSMSNTQKISYRKQALKHVGKTEATVLAEYEDWEQKRNDVHPHETASKSNLVVKLKELVDSTQEKNITYKEADVIVASLCEITEEKRNYIFSRVKENKGM